MTATACTSNRARFRSEIHFWIRARNRIVCSITKRNVVPCEKLFSWLFLQPGFNSFSKSPKHTTPEMTIFEENDFPRRKDEFHPGGISPWEFPKHTSTKHKSSILDDESSTQIYKEKLLRNECTLPNVRPCLISMHHEELKQQQKLWTPLLSKYSLCDATTRFNMAA